MEISRVRKEWDMKKTRGNRKGREWWQREEREKLQRESDRKREDKLVL